MASRSQAGRSRPAKAGQAGREADPQPVEASPQADPQAGQAEKPKAASRGSSRASSGAADPFYSDRGAGFDADAVDGAEEPLEREAPIVEPVLWTPERVRRVLSLQGDLAHGLVGVAEQDWVWLGSELDMVCGPLADHCNRVPALAALAHLSDDAAIAAGFFSYLTRSWVERTRELRARRDAPKPATGRRAEPPPRASAPPEPAEDVMATTTAATPDAGAVEINPQEVTWTPSSP